MAYEPQRLQQVSAKEATALGLPDGYKMYSPFPFAATNQEDSRIGLEDVEFFWLENMLRLGKGLLRSAPGQDATPFYTTSSEPIVFAFFYDIGDTPYCAVFFEDGTATQVNVSTGATTTITSVEGEFFDVANPTALPACVQWGTKYLIISNNNTSNDYWIWDGSVLYTRGTLGPIVTMTGAGAGYDGTQPTMTAYGGHGTGTTFEATVAGGGVVLVSITNPGSGYLPGEYVAIQFADGGIADAGCIATVPLVASTVAAIEVLDGGFGYTAATVVVSGGVGTGCTATATVSNGRVVSITVTAPGSGFEDSPSVAISGDGAGAKAAAYLVPVSIDATGSSIVDTDPGAGFWRPPSASILGGGGTGAGIVSLALASTTVAEIRVVDPGYLYSGVANTTVDNTGSGGASAAGTAQMAEGRVKSVNITNAGSSYERPPLVYSTGVLATGGTLATYQAYLVPTVLGTGGDPGNAGQGFTSAPTIIPDAGANNAAYATATVMPFGVSGGAIETFQSRVWTVFPREKLGSLAHTDGTMLVSDPSDLVNFPTVFVNEQSVLRARYVAIKQSNGYLYAFGDSSIDIISNVQTSGDPSITTFNYQNVEPQVGTTFRDTIQPLGRSLYFANKNGVFRLAGGAVTRASEQINDIFETALFPDSLPTAGITPSAGTVYIHNHRYYVLLLTILDPFTEEPRNVMLAYDEKGWYVLTQESEYDAIFTRVVEGDLNLFGRNSTDITQLFTTPSATLEKVVATKLYGSDTFGFLKLIHNVMLEGKDMSSDDAGVAIDIVVNTELPAPAASVTLDFQADLSDSRVFSATAKDVRGRFLGLTLGSVSKDFALYNIAIGYTLEQGPIGADESNAPPVE